MVRGAYALQKLRIQTGLRLCANFRQKLKIEEDEEEEQEDELGAKAVKLIDELKAIYARLTDGVARNRTLPKREGFVGEGVVSDFTELVLIHQYQGIERQEREQFRLLGEALELVPIYTAWLHNQVGIGPALAAVLVTWFDVRKAERPSQFWAFAGLDVAPVLSKIICKVGAGDAEEWWWVQANSVQQSEEDAVRQHQMHGPFQSEEDARQDQYRVCGGGLARSRRKQHLVEREYIDRNGETKTKLSTTFDPWLQSRLLGVLGGSLLRSGSPYRKYYDQYRHRIETDTARPKGTLLDKKKMRAAGQIDEAEKLWHPLRIHRASMRYMVKQFVADFWRQWRLTEGLPVVPTYHEAVQGHKHHESTDKGPTSKRAAA